MGEGLPTCMTGELLRAIDVVAARLAAARGEGEVCSLRLRDAMDREDPDPTAVAEAVTMVRIVRTKESTILKVVKELPVQVRDEVLKRAAGCEGVDEI